MLPKRFFLNSESEGKMKTIKILLPAVILLMMLGCSVKENETIVGGEVVENPLGETVIVTGTLATLTLSATYNIGVAMIQVSLTNTASEVIIPRIVSPITQPYCYMVTVKDSDGNALNTTTFGIDEFEDQFDAYNLLPGLTYTEYEWVVPWELTNDPAGGKLRADVWLSKTSDLGNIYYMWAEVNLAIDWPW